jgi:MFS-type transporter involved in bile tolerance (Atg22 family)
MQAHEYVELAFVSIFMTPFAWMLTRVYQAFVPPLTANYEFETIWLGVLFGAMLMAIGSASRSAD